VRRARLLEDLGPWVPGVDEGLSAIGLNPHTVAGIGRFRGTVAHDVLIYNSYGFCDGSTDALGMSAAAANPLFRTTAAGTCDDAAAT
jgi:hypothetical protein